MDAPALLDREGLFAVWRRLATGGEFGQWEPFELDERGEVVMNLQPSARRQIVLTDIFCQITEQIGHLAAMSVPVTTHSIGIRVPDVVWMPGDKWESFDRQDPMPFVPDLCVEVLLDSDRQRDMDRRIMAYLEGGADEVIVVRQSGQVEFWGTKGQRHGSMFGITLPLERTYFEEGGVSNRPGPRR
jgi:Uma2 family endonuclease